VLDVFTAGGGGIGPARERALESIIADWRGGLLSTVSAMRDYGVEIGLKSTADGRRRITATRAEESAASEI
jgi:N-methylhydantoinase B/oxoprolinase/acetone carboxylase alpha subunit